MNYLSGENLSKSFGDRYLFQNINIGISKGEKMAIVGANGAGKTTLLNILAGTIEPEKGGNVSIRKGIRVGYLSQNPVFNEELSIMDTLFEGDSEALKAIKKYEKALISQNDEELADALVDMDTHSAWDYESKISQILGKLGISDFDKKIKMLSGGQRKRVAMARILIEEPDLMIFDEPTNHLDIDTVEWLEQSLTASQITLILVTHDRYFLDNVCNLIIEIENSRLYIYQGNYSYYLEKKAERDMIEAAEMDKAKNLYTKELEWMRRQPQARGTKAQYRIDAFGELDAKVNAKKEDSKVTLNVKMTRQGSKVLEAQKISKSFGSQKIIENFEYIFQRKDRIGVVGKNGMGKSTFLNILTQNLQPDNGIIEVGDTTTFGYYTQSDFDFKPSQRVIDIITEIAEVVTVGTGETISASQFLTHFKFEPKVQYNLVSKLSGGEKRRLQLMQVLIKNPNFLILDEPTNDLDITTLNILEDFLVKFGGCLLLVSHDRYFMDKLVESLFVFEGNGKIRHFPGNYTDYRAQISAEQKAANTSPKTNTTKTEKVIEKSIEVDTKVKRKLSFKEQQELAAIEKTMPELEAKKADLTTQMNSGSLDYTAIAQLADAIQKLSDQLEEMEMRWLELSE